MPPGHAVNNGGGGRCLDDETLALLLEGALDTDEDADVRAHLDTCNACRTLFAEAARSADSGIQGPKVSAAADPPRRGKVLTYVTLEAGDVVAGKYRVERRIGVGGMGYVLAARHVDLDQLVALKVMRPEMLADTDAVRRFAREAKSAASLHSEHAVRIFDVGRLETGTPYIVMEYLEGFDLSSLLEKEGPLPIATAVDYLLQVCDALAEAHGLGIIHRDLKPHNMFLTRARGGEACVKVLDFGLAKATANSDMDSSAMTGTNVMLGSPFFMSPEQVHSTRDVDHRTDIWSLGATLYHLVAGVPPFVAPNVHLVCARILSEDFPPIAKRRADAPPQLEALLRRCMARSPDARFANVAELVTALRDVRNVAAHDPPPPIDSQDVSIVDDQAMDTTRVAKRKAPEVHDDTTIAKPQPFRSTDPLPPVLIMPAPMPAPAVPQPVPMTHVVRREVATVPSTRTQPEKVGATRSVVVLAFVGVAAVGLTFAAFRMVGKKESAAPAPSTTVVAVTTAAPAASAVPAVIPVASAVPSTTTTTTTTIATPEPTASVTKSTKPPRTRPPRVPNTPDPDPYAHP